MKSIQKPFLLQQVILQSIHQIRFRLGEMEQLLLAVELAGRLPQNRFSLAGIGRTRINLTRHTHSRLKGMADSSSHRLSSTSAALAHPRSRSSDLRHSSMPSQELQAERLKPHKDRTQCGNLLYWQQGCSANQLLLV